MLDEHGAGRKRLAAGLSTGENLSAEIANSASGKIGKSAWLMQPDSIRGFLKIQEATKFV
jgi:hypothetical protein